MKEEYIKNIKMLLNSADLVYRSGDFTSATILYFKLSFTIIDFIIFTQSGETPKDHSERFRIIQKDFSDLYLFLDRYFKIYRDTYSTSIEKDKCDIIIKNVKQIIEKYKIPV